MAAATVNVRLLLLPGEGALTLGTSSESGLNLVPLEGPPTYHKCQLYDDCSEKLLKIYEDDCFGRGSAGAIGLSVGYLK